VHGSKGPDGFLYRPDIVWFGEDVPNMFRAEQLVASADILAVIGTSLQVYPAAGLLYAKPYDAELVVIDKRIPGVGSFSNTRIIEAPATEGVITWVKELLSQ
jgi:NAD-dependent deacetylase